MISNADYQHSLGVQGGWFNVEADYVTPFGLFADLGIPWFILALAYDDSSDWFIPIETKLGYQFEISEGVKLRAGARAVFGFCEGCGEGPWGTTVLFELGIRYEDSSGFLMGLELPVYGLHVIHDSLHDTTDIMHLTKGISFIYTQMYFGYAWKL
ncbi:MAG: hypothetical protein JRJ87_26160 [Deltaproteobacteria bacterium]|nr:hypothetical protein [Deltaproteobacteria bacterium]